MSIDLDALEALCNAATDGPWELTDFNEGDDPPRPLWGVVNPPYYNPLDHPDEDAAEVEVHTGGKEDAEFIAAARTALPVLLAEVRTLREQLAEAKQIIRDSNEAEDHTTKLIDQMYAKIRQHRAQRDQVLALHTEYEGRCIHCVEWCDCLCADACTHGNVEWPCPTAAICAAQPAQTATQGITPTPPRTDAHGHHSGPHEAVRGKGGEQ